MKEVFNPAHGVPLDAPNIVGAVSVIFWALMVLVNFAVMATWKRGRELLIEQIRSDDPDLLPFITSLTEDETAHRAARTAVYAVANPGAVPQALTHNIKHYQVLHQRSLIMSVKFEEVPRVPTDRARAGHATGQRLLACASELRFHGRARHSQGTGAMRRAGIAD